ncbi:MAG: hypothetical protein ACKV2O_05120 [Acidimicrobiales bacterium]
MISINGEAPATDDAAFQAYAESLPVPYLARVVNGQGMSVAAMQARTLGQVLQTHSVDEAQFRVNVSQTSRTGGDFQWAGTKGQRPRGNTVLNRYVNRLLRAAHTQGHVAETFFQVQQLMTEPQAPMQPTMVWEALRHGGHRASTHSGSVSPSESQDD